VKTITLREEGKKDYFITEAYRTLRTNMQFCGKDVHVIALTSCMPNEGKTTLTIELAKSLAEIGKKVLMIDADLRKSVVVKKYTKEQGVVGLSQFLSQQATEEDVLYKTQYEGLDIIFAGQYPPNPVELLGSLAFREYMQECKKKYDYVLIDTPPLGMVIDGAVVASSCDSAIMVINAGKIHRAQAIEVRDQLMRSGVRILGVVLNHADAGKRMNKATGSYLSKYSRYYRYEGKYMAHKSQIHAATAAQEARPQAPTAPTMPTTPTTPAEQKPSENPFDVFN
jgi:capsular exopolysaccharide synthesis family protein